jgi:hypothetical protein
VTVGAKNNVILTQNLRYADPNPATSSDIVGLSADGFVQLYRPLTCGTTSAWREALTQRCLGGTDVTVAGRYPGSTRWCRGRS